MITYTLKNKKQFIFYLIFFPCLPVIYLLCISLLPPTKTRFNYATVSSYEAKF